MTPPTLGSMTCPLARTFLIGTTADGYPNALSFLRNTAMRSTSENPTAK